MPSINKKKIVAWGNELTPNFDSRTELWACYVAFGLAGTLVGIGLPAAVTFGPDCDGSAEDGCYSLGLMTLLNALLFYSVPVWILCKLVPERDYSSGYVEKNPDDGIESHPLQSVIDSLGRTDLTKNEIHSLVSSNLESPNHFVANFIQSVLNEPFRLLLIQRCVQALTELVPLMVMPYIAKWVVGEDDFRGDTLFVFWIAFRMGASAAGVWF